jgi:preprotein translocase subunit SecF
MMRRLRRGDFHFNIVGRARQWFIVSGIVVLVSIVSLFGRGINAGLEFRGGSAFRVEAASTHESVTDVRSAVQKAGVTEPTVQKAGARGFQVETQHLTPDQQDKVATAIAKVSGVKRNDVEVEDVGPKWGQQITNKAIRALIIFLVVVTLYMSVRLEPKMAGAAFIALIHDLVITAGIYSLTGFEVTPATIIALLTVLGYSLYDTVVIFDRVKERTQNLSASANVTYTDAANQSVNQVLMRSLNTSITGLLPVGSLLFVGSFLLGAQTLRELALALFIGLTTGTYSSIFLATPLVAVWKEREERWTKLRSRIAARGGGAPSPAAPPARVVTAQPAPVPVPSATMEVRDVITPPPSTRATQPADAGQQARPAGGGSASARARKRKKRKRKRR